MHNLDRDSFETLKVINKYDQIDKSKLIGLLNKDEQKLKEQIDTFLQFRYIEFPMAYLTGDFGDLKYDENIIKITNKGKVYIEQLEEDYKRWKIPVIISVVALIFSCLSMVESFGLLEILLKMLGL
ncbi:MAG: hypothetical protein PHN55_15215 [Dysgonamonadaceae bacterium]|nr:hypothetical protein [Dysgonamonadaceae bacterium]